MFAAHRATAMVAVVVLAGCGGDSEPAPSPAPTTDPAVTAPPALSPEEQAEVEIKATFEELIAAWDDFKANASDYGGAPGWNSDLVSQWSVDGDANAELANWLAGWRSSEVEQVGSTTITDHSVSSIDTSTSGGSGLATSVACLGLAELEYRTYGGADADLPSEPADYQTWSMTWISSQSGSGAPARSGWRLFEVDVAIDEPC